MMDRPGPITDQDMRLRFPGDVGFLARRGRAWLLRRRAPASAYWLTRGARLPADQAARLRELRAGAPA